MRMPYSVGIFGTIVASLLLAACFSAAQAVVSAAPEQSAAQACDALVGMAVPASAIALPTKGATVSATKLMPSSANFGEYCVVQGAIAPAAGGSPIYFQINLPTEWNQRSVHFGGGGFDGAVVAGLNAFGEGHPKEPRPLAAGYVTFGSDSGHSNNADGSPAFNQNLQGGTRTKRPACRPRRRLPDECLLRTEQGDVCEFRRRSIEKDPRRRGRNHQKTVRPRAREDVLFRPFARWTRSGARRPAVRERLRRCVCWCAGPRRHRGSDRLYFGHPADVPESRLLAERETNRSRGQSRARCVRRPGWH